MSTSTQHIKFKSEADAYFASVSKRSHKLGRPKRKPEDKRSITVKLRLNLQELAILDARARAQGMTRSAFLRSMIYDEPVSHSSDEALKSLVQSRFFTEFSRQGNNLNQIARKLNSGDESAKEALQSIVDTYNHLEVLFNNSVGDN